MASDPEAEPPRPGLRIALIPGLATLAASCRKAAGASVDWCDTENSPHALAGTAWTAPA